MAESAALADEEAENQPPKGGLLEGGQLLAAGAPGGLIEPLAGRVFALDLPDRVRRRAEPGGRAHPAVRDAAMAAGAIRSGRREGTAPPEAAA